MHISEGQWLPLELFTKTTFWVIHCFYLHWFISDVFALKIDSPPPLEPSLVFSFWLQIEGKLFEETVLGSLCENRFLVNLMYPEEFCFLCYSFIGNRRTVPHLVSGILTPSHGSLIRNVTICSSVSLFSFWPKKHWFCKGLWT